MDCYSSKVVCSALTMYCIMNEYENDSHKNPVDVDHVIQAKRRKLTDLNDNETKAIFKNEAFEILEQLTSNAFSYDMDRLSQIILNFIDGLSKGLEHWKIPKNLSTVYFYASSWLKGKNPPPRCKAYINELLCLEEAAKNSSFCHLLHNCHSTDCKNQRILPTTPFCIGHLCQIQDCNFERLLEFKLSRSNPFILFF